MSATLELPVTTDIVVVDSTENTVDVRYGDTTFLCRYHLGSQGVVCHQGHVDHDQFIGGPCALKTDEDIATMKVAVAHFEQREAERIAAEGYEPYGGKVGTCKPRRVQGSECKGCGASVMLDIPSCPRCETPWE